MTISELSAGQGNVNVEGTIGEVGEVKNFNKFGRELRVANAILKDDSGTIKLTLWNDEATKFKEGDKVKIENGYVNEFQGEPQLTAGKFGKIELVSEGAGDSAQEKLPSEGNEAPVEESEDKKEDGEEAAEEKVEEAAEESKDKKEDKPAEESKDKKEESEDF